MKKINIVLTILILAPTLIFGQMFNAMRIYEYRHKTDTCNFLIEFTPRNVISVIPLYTIDQRNPYGNDLSFVQPSTEMNMGFRFGEGRLHRQFFTCAIHVTLAFARTESLFAFGISYPKFGTEAFFGSCATRVTYETSLVGFSRRYTYANLFGIMADYHYVLHSSVHLAVEDKDKFRYLANVRIPTFIVPRLRVGLSSESFYGSGFLFEKILQDEISTIIVSWLVPRDDEKKLYDSRNGVHVSARIYIF